jgi:PhnB protein
MAIKKLNPYLNFNGTAERAIKLYESALGARTDRIVRFGDIPDFNLAPGNKNLVMHAALFIGGGVIMVSDEHKKS